MKDCLSSGEYKSLLATIGKYNDRLENLRPGTTDREQVLVSGMENRYDGRWDSFRRSASSLYCALYSSWQCSCPGVHTAHFRLEDRTSTMSARQRFRLAFMLPGNYGGPTVTSAVTSAVTEGAGWQDAEFEASESDEDEDEEAVLQRQRGRVSFQPRATSVASRQVLDKQITNLCEELKGCGGSTTARCVGFITEKKRRHYLHVSKRAEFPSAMQRAVSLHELLTGKGSVSSPVPLTIELLDRYELGLLLALSMLQLHATSWLADCWSARDIHFIPTDSESTLRDCAFVVRSFLSAKDQAVAVAATTPAHPAGGGSDIRSVAIRNEAIFRLGVALVELSTNATLESQELERDRRVADLADMNTARRLVSSKQFERSNVREWKAVIDICLYCGFHTSPDFSKKEFRDEYYKYVVRPLQKLCDDAK